MLTPVDKNNVNKPYKSDNYYKDVHLCRKEITFTDKNNLQKAQCLFYYHFLQYHFYHVTRQRMEF